MILIFLSEDGCYQWIQVAAEADECPYHQGYEQEQDDENDGW